MHSEGFAGADAISSASSDNEVVPLSENSAILELLLQYMYRQPQPDLRTVNFATLAGVAEAAEKYQVYAATTVCNIYMRFVLTFSFAWGSCECLVDFRAATEEHPHQVLAYAYKHNYTDIMDKAAPLAISQSASFMTYASVNAPSIFLAWVKQFRMLAT